MNSLNQCNFIGRLGKEPESRLLSTGASVTNFSIACGWKSKEAEGTEWVNITAFGKLADLTRDYLSKGSLIFVSGRLQTDKWKNKEGFDQYSTKIIADKIQFLNKVEKPADHKAQASGDDSDIPF